MTYRAFTQIPQSRMPTYLWRAMIFLFIILVGLGASESAFAASKRVYAGIVVDAKSGKTLYAQAADAERYPASVTKVMTLYVLFQELDAGRMKLSTKLSVSKHAAAAVPTKLGLKAGSTISVENAIKSLVTISANDMARVIAENISGTESKFAERMTKTAKALGMSRTTYRNASGLPDSHQITTARDQARLGIAIYQHFPKYYEYFQTRSFKYNGRTYGNHNRLLGQNGVDGIKTGYINASGYNLLTAARQNDRHIVVVGFGFDSGTKRDSKVASLVSSYISKARKGTYVAQAIIAKPGSGGSAPALFAAVPVTPMPRPANRMYMAENLVAPVPLAPIDLAPDVATVAVASIVTPVSPIPEPRPVQLMPASAVEAATQVASNDLSAPTPMPKPADIVGAWTNQTLRLGPDDAIRPPEPIGGRTATIDLLTSGAIGKPANDETWVLQVGAAPTEPGAHSLLQAAVGANADLSTLRSFVEPAKKNGQIFYRARFSGFGSGEDARKTCTQLQEKNISCLAMQS